MLIERKCILKPIKLVIANWKIKVKKKTLQLKQWRAIYAGHSCVGGTDQMDTQWQSEPIQFLHMKEERPRKDE